MKTILIIGSSGGLGTELIKYFKKENCQLILHYFTHKPKEKENENTLLISANITVEAEVIKMMDEISLRFGKLDAVINNAGISISEIESLKSENWFLKIERTFSTPAISNV